MNLSARTLAATQQGPALETKIYLDHNSTTPPDPAVVASMVQHLTSDFGNPSSAHSLGSDAAQAVAVARGHVGNLVGAEAEDVMFCSSATEAINTVLASITAGKVITTAVEHVATLRGVDRLEQRGVHVVRLPVNAAGQIDLDQLAEAVDGTTSLVSALWANNETGVLFPIERIAEICAKHSVPLHVDAVQAVGKLPIHELGFPIEYLSISAHKINGPKGVGALVTNGETRLLPLLVGGGQEAGRRAGTENVPGIVGFGVAASLAQKHLPIRTERVEALREKLEKMVLEQVPSCWINGQSSPRLPNTSNIGFGGIDADELVLRLNAMGICVSTGSACHSSAGEPSHVIRAMTGSYEAARGSVRFSLSHITTEAEIDYVISAIPRAVASLRS